MCGEVVSLETLSERDRFSQCICLDDAHRKKDDGSYQDQTAGIRLGPRGGVKHYREDEAHSGAERADQRRNIYVFSGPASCFGRFGRVEKKDTAISAIRFRNLLRLSAFWAIHDK